MEEEITLEEEQERALQEQMDIGKSLLYPISRARTVESTGWISRKVQTQDILFLKSMSERGGSDIERL